MIHNHEVAGSIPAPATLEINELQKCGSFFFCYGEILVKFVTKSLLVKFSGMQLFLMTILVISVTFY